MLPRLTLLALLVGCGSNAPEPTPEPAPAAAPDAAPKDAPEATSKPPAGKIGGDPILPKPVVVGGIANDAVEAGIAKQMDAINACWSDARTKDPKVKPGKVLVKFTIDKDGTVNAPKTQSTSVRHEATEDCVNQQVAKASFPPLAEGKLAIVRYPFVFPPPE